MKLARAIFKKCGQHRSEYRIDCQGNMTAALSFPGHNFRMQSILSLSRLFIVVQEFFSAACHPTQNSASKGRKNLSPHKSIAVLEQVFAIPPLALCPSGSFLHFSAGRLKP